MGRTLYCFFAFVSVLILATAAFAKQQVQLPTDPTAWLNSPPISNEMLKGKAAVLYFFEES